ncbi:unnamed protein product [Angiostrongylus costaricensis]|uniref:Uncharacterized protein n=1 Tax=Angiostrongylus costaricensis TaxID=334426 RepID=A0A0R3PVY9_ANGCS|nr:unnamed protein product [Angiostrongylus costaricensis]
MVIINIQFLCFLMPTKRLQNSAILNTNKIQDKLNMTAVTYVIEPIEGRAAIQKNFIKLPERAQNYSNRHVTLNERFSIIERGYCLKPVKLQKRSDNKQVSFISLDSVSPEERIANGIAMLEKKRIERQRVTSEAAQHPQHNDGSEQF